MLRLVAGLVAAFIVGGLAAMPFASPGVAAQGDASSGEASDEDTVCCDATAQYDTLEFATRAGCRSRNGVVVENNRCAPESDDQPRVSGQIGGVAVPQNPLGGLEEVTQALPPAFSAGNAASKVWLVSRLVHASIRKEEGYLAYDDRRLQSFPQIQVMNYNTTPARISWKCAPDRDATALRRLIPETADTNDSVTWSGSMELAALTHDYLISGERTLNRIVENWVEKGLGWKFLCRIESDSPVIVDAWNRESVFKRITYNDDISEKEYFRILSRSYTPAHVVKIDQE